MILGPYFKIKTQYPLLNMKTVTHTTILLFCLLFMLPIFGQQNAPSLSNSKNIAQNKDNDDDDDDDDCDDDDDDDDDDEDCDNRVIKHPSLYFVQLDPTLTTAQVDALLNDLNSEEIWYRPEINLRLWNTVALPYINAQGQNITNIDRQVMNAQDKTEIDGTDFNIGAINTEPITSIPTSCFNTIEPQQVTSTNPIKISIFDTGYSQPITNIPGYEFDITSFTGYDYIDDDTIPEDRNGHGTHIASVIHHLINQNAPSTSVVFDIRKTHNNQGQGFLSELIPAILDAVNEGANILNFSFSYRDFNTNPNGKPLKQAIDYAEQMGAVVIAASGNTSVNNDRGNVVAFPATYPNSNIISVASTNCNDALSVFSSFGRTSVDVALLGNSIPGAGLNNNVAYQSGTSYAAANITAFVAILGSHQTNFNYQDIKCALINTSTPNTLLNQKVVANGIVNFSNAFAQLSDGCNPQRVINTGLNQKRPKPIFISNPFHNMMQIQMQHDLKDLIQISIYNQSGTLLLKDHLIPAKDTTVIDITETQQLDSGLYLVKIEIKDYSEVMTIIKR